MLDVTEFKVEMAKHADTQRSVATVMNVTPQTVGDKLHGLAEFKRKEIEALVRHWSLSGDRLMEIFFSSEQ